MIIAAIDPGTRESALVLWDGRAVREAHLLPNEQMLSRLREGPFVSFAPDGALLVVEQVESYGMAVGREVFETVWWAGRFVEAWPSKFQMVPRRTVKLHLCNSMKAKDANIRQALLDRFGAQGTKKAPGLLYGITSHKWAALALAVTVHDQQTQSNQPQHQEA